MINFYPEQAKGEQFSGQHCSGAQSQGHASTCCTASGWLDSDVSTGSAQARCRSKSYQSVNAILDFPLQISDRFGRATRKLHSSLQRMSAGHGRNKLCRNISLNIIWRSVIGGSSDRVHFCRLKMRNSIGHTQLLKWRTGWCLDEKILDRQWDFEPEIRD